MEYESFFALLLAIAARRFSCTLFGKGGASTKSLVSLSLIDKTGLALGKKAGVGAGIRAGYLIFPTSTSIFLTYQEEKYILYWQVE